MQATIESPAQPRRGPVSVRAAESGACLGDWLDANHDVVAGLLAECGAVRFRGFAIEDEDDFEAAARRYTPELAEYVGGGAIRSAVRGRIYRSSEYAAHQLLALHCETTYLPAIPDHIWFSCMVPPAEGGQTPIGDMGRVLARLDDSLVNRFEAHGGLRYIYNLHDGKGFGRGWRDAFPARDRSEVGEWLTQQGCEFHWDGDGTLHVEMIGPVLRTHPASGERVWGNQVHLWHSAGVAPATQAALMKVYGTPRRFPKHAEFADGASIPDSDIAEILGVLGQEESAFEWERGDVMLCDNHRMAHGRRPFRGDRRIVVALA